MLFGIFLIIQFEAYPSMIGVLVARILTSPQIIVDEIINV